MTNILIRAKREKVEHKLEKNLLKEYGSLENINCYWTGIHPQDVCEGDKVMFTDGSMVYAEGVIYQVNYDDGLVFSPLKEVCYIQPKKAPTRGFTYVRKG